MRESVQKLYIIILPRLSVKCTINIKASDNKITIISELMESPVWSGTLNSQLILNMDNIENSKFQDSKLIINKMDEELKTGFNILEKYSGHKLLSGNNDMIIEISGTLNNPGFF